MGGSPKPSQDKENAAPITPKLSKLSSQLSGTNISNEKKKRSSPEVKDEEIDDSPVAKAPLKKKRKVIAFSDSEDEQEVVAKPQPFVKKSEATDQPEKPQNKPKTKEDSDFEVVSTQSSDAESDMDFS